MKKIAFILLVLVIMCFSLEPLYATDEPENLYARAAVLIDADSGRILFGKNENEILAMASTTKLMTLIIALEYGNLEDEVTFSKYASKEPDVQLNALAGEKYKLKDLLYIMMLRSYNDVAMAVAEHVGGIISGDTSVNETTEESKADVFVFVNKMNEKAKKYGCKNTYFITPNGLDASDEHGKHSTTAYELAIIASQAIKSPDVLKICGTKNYSYRELTGKRSGNITNADRFLDMQTGALGLKTGFTGEAGYCFVGAVKQDDRTYISVVLGSGWPPNKNYKWSDTKKLMNYGIKNFFNKEVLSDKQFQKKIHVNNGVKEWVDTYIPFNLKFLLKDDDKVDVIYKTYDCVNAPIKVNEEVGEALIYINNILVRRVPILSRNYVKNKNFYYNFTKLFKAFCI